MWTLLVTLFVTTFVAAPPQAGGQWPTLAAELGDHSVPVPDGVNAAVQITSFSTFEDERTFAIGYYDVVADGLLHDLHVRVFDKRARVWRSATFAGIGSVLSVKRHGGVFLVGGHSSPSSGPLLVLSDDLRLKRELEGWIVYTIPDGRVLFERGMVHFAPMHAGVLAVYDPAANRDTSIFPAGAGNDRGGERVPGTDLWFDRSIGEVTTGAAPHTIEFDVTTQHVSIGSDNRGHPAGPERKVHVVCDTSKRIPACTPARD